MSSSGARSRRSARGATKPRSRRRRERQGSCSCSASELLPAFCSAASRASGLGSVAGLATFEQLVLPDVRSGVPHGRARWSRLCPRKSVSSTSACRLGSRASRARVRQGTERDVGQRSTTRQEPWALCGQGVVLSAAAGARLQPVMREARAAVPPLLSFLARTSATNRETSGACSS